MGEGELTNCNACRRTVMSASNQVPLELIMRSAPHGKYWEFRRSVHDAPTTLDEISGILYRGLSDEEKGDNRPEQMVICDPDGEPLMQSTYTELIRRAEAHSSALPADCSSHISLPLQLTAHFVTKELFSCYEENKRLAEENKRLAEENKMLKKRIENQDADI